MLHATGTGTDATHRSAETALDLVTVLCAQILAGEVAVVGQGPARYTPTRVTV